MAIRNRYASRVTRRSRLVRGGPWAACIVIVAAACPAACHNEGRDNPPQFSRAEASAVAPASAASAAGTPTVRSAQTVDTATLGPPAAVPPTPLAMSSRASLRSASAWAPCRAGDPPGGSTPAARVAALAERCTDRHRNKRLGDTTQNTQRDSAAPQTFALSAQEGHCYRVLVGGDDAIGDLYVAVRDADGNVAGETSTPNSTAILSTDGAVCFSASETASVVVSVGRGAGAYALQIWSD